ncbi:hypothetical protein PBRA_005528 [Plasmodiophora brassicae]|uniref:Fe2OG dioxygenase domain-containing protein n=1 Tax=Plasmodiophora brassicae TaxID=37360 RepID=A0A0G4IP30_PLABS|nr:hypothetical protein PBRA_005528 [Plasmodiophora brassicae]
MTKQAPSNSESVLASVAAGDSAFDDDDADVVDVTEAELLALLDANENPLLTCRRLFLPGAGRHRLQVLSAADADRLYRDGVVVIDGFVDGATVASARHSALSMRSDGFRDNDARDDVIAWLHAGQGGGGPLDAVLARLECLRRDLSRLIALRGTVEYQLAVYAPGGRYEKHRDALPIDDPEDDLQRRVTAICYLNDDEWDVASDGGALRVFVPVVDDDDDPGRTPDGGAVVDNGSRCMDIEPRAGRLALFLSGAIDHAVLPAHRERVAVTAWIR